MLKLNNKILEKIMFKVQKKKHQKKMEKSLFQKFKPKNRKIKINKINECHCLEN